MIAAMLGTILPDLSSRFQLTPRQNGTIALAQALGLVVASLGVGPLLDDFGKKVGLILGLALIFIALLAIPRSAGFRSIVILLFLLGMGGGIVVTGANALTSDVGESLQPQLGSPLLHRCWPHPRHTRHPGRRAHAAAHRRRALHLFRCRPRS